MFLKALVSILFRPSPYHLGVLPMVGAGIFKHFARGQNFSSQSISNITFLGFGLSVVVLIWFLARKDRAEKLLRRSEKLHRAVFSGLTEGVFICDLNGKITICNTAAEQILGQSPGKLVGRDYREIILDRVDLLGEPILVELGPVQLSLTMGKEVTGFQMGFTREDGEKKWAWINSRPLQFEDEEKTSSVLVSILDVTDWKRSEDLIREQRSKIEASAKLSSLGEMAAGIAHEVNNPLAIIQLRSQQLKELGAKPPVDASIVVSYAEKMEQTVMRIARIVGGLRAFAREAENDPFYPTRVNDLLNSTLELCSSRFKNSGIEIRTKPVSDELTLECRSSQISQVLISILNNAFDALEEASEKWVEVGVKDLGQEIEISVTDSGPGIPSQIREKILQPFFTTKPIGKGTGLGLSSSRGLVGAHGGTLELDSLSKRTRFVIILPKVQENQSSTARTAA